MNKYVVIYYAPASAVEQTQEMNPEQMQEGMNQWLRGPRNAVTVWLISGRPWPMVTK